MKRSALAVLKLLLALCLLPCSGCGDDEEVAVPIRQIEFAHSVELKGDWEEGAHMISSQHELAAAIRLFGDEDQSSLKDLIDWEREAVIIVKIRPGSGCDPRLRGLIKRACRKGGILHMVKDCWAFAGTKCNVIQELFDIVAVPRAALRRDVVADPDCEMEPQKLE